MAEGDREKLLDQPHGGECVGRKLARRERRLPAGERGVDEDLISGVRIERRTARQILREHERITLLANRDLTSTDLEPVAVAQPMRTAEPVAVQEDRGFAVEGLQEHLVARLTDDRDAEPSAVRQRDQQSALRDQIGRAHV